MKRRSLLKIMLSPLVLLTPNSVVAAAGTYCDGHRDGHRHYYDVKGAGYPGYPGCAGDAGGFGTPYKRGYQHGLLQAQREDSR